MRATNYFITFDMAPTPLPTLRKASASHSSHFIDNYSKRMAATIKRARTQNSSVEYTAAQILDDAKLAEMPTVG